MRRSGAGSSGITTGSDDGLTDALPRREQLSLSVADTVGCLLGYLQRSGPGELPASRLLDLVIVDSRRGEYPNGLDLARIAEHGVRVLDVPLVTARSAPLIDPRRLAEVLVSLV